MAEKLKNKVTDGFQKGHPYGELPPCIHVGILNFNQMISPNYYHKFCLSMQKRNNKESHYINGQN